METAKKIFLIINNSVLFFCIAWFVVAMIVDTNVAGFGAILIVPVVLITFTAGSIVFGYLKGESSGFRTPALVYGLPAIIGIGATFFLIN